MYIDDLLVFRKDEESNFRHLEMVLERLKEHELYVSTKNIEFLKEEMDFHGLLVGKDGIMVNQKMV